MSLLNELQVFEISFASYVFIVTVIFLNSDLLFVCVFFLFVGLVFFVWFLFFNVIIVQNEKSLDVILVEQPVTVFRVLVCAFRIGLVWHETS